MALRPDETLGERYRLTELIAVGGMGEVWRAEDSLLGRTVAVKALKAEYAGDATFIERFRAEARHTAALSHPGIANVYDYGEIAPERGGAGASAYLVMELVEGEPLSALLARDKRLTPARTMDVIGQAALALQAAHEAGVVHRDVKPGNLLVRPDGVVKVTDFGIARVADAVPLTQTGMVMGTAYYLSPEQGAGRTVTAASDVYSLGVVAYECLAGRRPFIGDNPVTVAMAHMRDDPPPLPPDVPQDVAALVEQALEKDPSMRPGSAGDFGRAALTIGDRLGGQASAPTVVVPPAVRRTDPDRTQVLTGLAAAPPPVTRTTRTTRVAPPISPPPRRRGPGAALILLGLLLLVALGALALRLADSGSDALTTPNPSTSPNPNTSPNRSTPSPSPTSDSSPGVSTIEVPGVVGDDVEDATETLEDEGFEVEVQRVDSSSSADEVLRQDPAAGSEAREGSTVTLEVSGGAQTIEIDAADFRGGSFDEARDQLVDLGLQVQRSDTGSGQQAGTVSDVEPDGELQVGDTVTVIVVPQEEEEETSAPPSTSPSPSAEPSPNSPSPSPSAPSPTAPSPTAPSPTAPVSTSPSASALLPGDGDEDDDEGGDEGSAVGLVDGGRPGDR